MADQNIKMDAGNKFLLVVAVLVLGVALVFLVYHLSAFLGQLALGQRDTAPAIAETAEQRMMPIGRVEVAAAVDPDAKPVAARPAVEVYSSVCATCHDMGVAGAPPISDREAWAARLDERGLETLVRHSIEGFQGMPARGGNPTLTDEEVEVTVGYMLAEAGLDMNGVAPVAEEPAPEPPAIDAAEVVADGDAERGAERYATCVSCHGAEGEGMGIFPQVSGESEAYVVDRLKQYRAGEMVGPNSALMWPQASALSDEAIADLAAYIATLGMPDVAPEEVPAVAPETVAPAMEGDGERGQEQFATCISCHGAEGQGMGIFPKVAGQSEAYVAGRLEQYRAGETVGPDSALMWGQASGLSDQAIADLAVYIAGLEPFDAAVEETVAEIAPEAEGDAERGQQLYGTCIGCHGAQGLGMGIFPNIAGEEAEYVAGRLTQYRAGETVGPNTPLMAPHAANLSDEDIADLAAYVSSL